MAEGSGRAGKRLLSIAVSATLLAWIYARLDRAALAQALRGADPFWLIPGVLGIFPLKLVQGWRLRQLLPRGSHLGLWPAVRLILVADVLNMVLPAKTGDLAKAYFLRDRERIDGALALSLVVFEKAYDVLALLLWCALALLLYPDKGPALQAATVGSAAAALLGFLVLTSERFARIAFRVGRALAPARLVPKVVRLEAAWTGVLAYFRAEKAQHARVAALSAGLWLLHFLQLWIFVFALRSFVPFGAHVALSALAILAGLVPFTFAGLGTRDAALIALCRPYLAPATAAALGILFTSRYVLPALAGLPFFRGALEQVRGSREPS